MSYLRFPNLDEILQGDLLGKLRERIGLNNFLHRECNCISTTKLKVECAYEGDCRACCIVCVSVYVGNTQITLKKIMDQHFQDVAQKVQHDKKYDTFAAHYAQHFGQKPTPQQCR